MRPIEAARALRLGADPGPLARRFVEGLASNPTLCDVAALTHRFAVQPSPPAQDVFHAVSCHLEGVLRSSPSGSSEAAGGPAPGARHGNAAGATGISIVLLAEAFARVQHREGIGALSLACLGAAPAQELAPQECLRLARACVELGAQSDAAIRGFLLMRLQRVAPRMEACDLAESAAVLARAHIYSPEVSSAIDSLLSGNPWAFELADLLKLLPHFQEWRLGSLQRKAFQALGSRFSELAELLSPEDALQVAETFTSVGSVHEVLLHHVYLRLLTGRAFAVLPHPGIAQLAAGMAHVQHYHTGLLREIVAHLGEEPSVAGGWSAEQLSGALKSFGLAPVHIPTPTLRLLGCRYASLLPSMDSAMLQVFFEVSAHFPDLLRAVLSTAAGRRLPSLLQARVQEWGARACADAFLALALTLEAPSRTGGLPACACASAGAATVARQTFRTEQPEDQLRVVLRTARNVKQGRARQLVARADVPTASALPGLFMVNDSLPDPPAVPRLRCRAAWARTGRRRTPGLPAGDSVGLLDAVLPQLLGRVRRSCEELAELPGMPEPAGLLEAMAEAALELGPQSAAGALQRTSPQGAGSAAAGAGGGGKGEGGELEVLRRSELLEVCAQTLAGLQLCAARGSALGELPLAGCQALLRLLPLVRALLRPRRDDEVTQAFHLGPQRLEAFVRRPDEPLLEEVRWTLERLTPFLPHHLGWQRWACRPSDRLHGRAVGGAFVSLTRDVEVPPFVVSLVLRPRSSPGC